MNDTKDNDSMFSVVELLLVLWSRRVVFCALVSFVVMIAIVVALLRPNLYESEVILAPQNSQSSLSGLARKFGSVATLAGVGLPEEEVGDAAVAYETLQSITFFEDFLYESILVELFASHSWDSKTNRLTFDEDIFDVAEEKWVREVDPPYFPKPGVSEAFMLFSEDHFALSKNKDTGIVTLKIRHRSPVVAARWAELIVVSINNSLREYVIQQSSKAISYLEEQRNSNVLVKIDEVFSNLVEEQVKTIMLARVNDDYIFKTIQRPRIAQFRSEPNRMLIVVVGTVIGLLFGITVVLFGEYVNRATSLRKDYLYIDKLFLKLWR